MGSCSAVEGALITKRSCDAVLSVEMDLSRKDSLTGIWCRLLADWRRRAEKACWLLFAALMELADFVCRYEV
jgi:hypothetical protein